MVVMAIAAVVVMVVVNLILIFLSWRGYRKSNEWFPLVLAICAFPVGAVLAGMMVYGNL